MTDPRARNTLIGEFATYLEEVKSSEFKWAADSEAIDFWTARKSVHPVLASLVVRLLGIRVSTAGVERSFSQYRKVLVPSRASLDPARLVKLVFIFCNQHLSVPGFRTHVDMVDVQLNEPSDDLYDVLVEENE